MPDQEKVAAGSVLRGFSRVVSVPWISALAMRIATRIDGPLLKLSRGRMRLSFIVPCLLLICRGAKTGLIREVPLLYVPDGEAVLLLGSGGGSEKLPAWCANVSAHPEVRTLCDGRLETRCVEQLQGQARADAWARAVTAYPGYAHYQARMSREIPVFRLHLRPH